MAIENLSLIDSDKTIDVIIDGHSYSIPIKIIERWSTEIIINQLKNTAFKDDIVVDATLTPVEQGVITISLWNKDKTFQYYINNVSTDDGHIFHKIPNNVPVGTYIVTLEYAGNKYYQDCSVDRQIEIRRREILCDFESRTFYAYPGDTFNKTFKLIDKINNQYISDCSISYLYKDEIFNIISDKEGNINLSIPIPNTNPNNCQTETVTYPIVFYLNNSDSYILKDTIIKIIIKKSNTQISAKYVKDNNNNYQYIQGDVIAEHGYVNYGCVEISILDSYQLNATVNEDGSFKTNQEINMNEILNGLTSNSVGVFDISKSIPTKIDIKNNGSDQIGIGKEIRITATVTDNENNIVVDGIVDFRMLNKDNKLVYRYATELDDLGQALFIFYTSKADKYTITASYSSVVTYKPSQNTENIIITVGE